MLFGRHIAIALVITAAASAAAHANPAARAAHGIGAALALTDAFLKSRDGLALLRVRGAAIDRSFAANGSYPFRIPGTAETGSRLDVSSGTAAVAPDSLTIVLPRAAQVPFAEVQRMLRAKAWQLPGILGRPWQYRFTRGAGRALDVATDGDARHGDSRIVRLTAIRER